MGCSRLHFTYTFHGVCFHNYNVKIIVDVSGPGITSVVKKVLSNRCYTAFEM